MRLIRALNCCSTYFYPIHMNRLAILADYLRKSFCLGWNVLDRPRVFLCLMRRFLARKELLKLTNSVMSEIGRAHV